MDDDLRSKWERNLRRAGKPLTETSVFRRQFRLAQPVAEKFITEFAASSMRPLTTHGGVPAKSAETHALAIIWYVANKTCMRDVASRFDLSRSSVHLVLQRVAEFLLTLGPSVIRFSADL
ncbi:hypothetical protein MRX96_047633 [Rhipicephalus microplus]